MTDDLRLSDRPGFTPMMARLVGMMDYTRLTTLQAVQGLSMEQLDTLPEGHGNTVAMLLEHFAAVEVYYQAASSGSHANPEDALGECWRPGMELGALGREHIRGRPLGHYLRQLAEVRAQTLALFARKDDLWLDEPVPLWGTTGNRHFMWFHVFEDELNHRGQIRLLVKALPGLESSGMLGVWLTPAHPDGTGMGCHQVFEGTPADLAGLRTGDVVLAYNGQAMKDVLFYEIPIAQPPGVRSHFLVQRGDETLEVSVVRALRPDPA
ncbi:DUF664 domain-containing protein [Deinococcus hohokamensis]|uniref:DUF664 domain-containing protein n=1 Tax=Deinococcus hohokamensis TaxID=309883 RepID=A0ABV9IBA7_9DEIO